LNPDQNSITISGRVERCPKLQQTVAGASVCTFSLAVETQWGAERPTYFEVVAWSDLADRVAEHVSVGDALVVTGGLRVLRRVNDDPPRPRYPVKIHAQDVGWSLLNAAPAAERPA
jgi:single-strand DNA-binding protein